MLEVVLSRITLSLCHILITRQDICFAAGDHGKADQVMTCPLLSAFLSADTIRTQLQLSYNLEDGFIFFFFVFHETHIVETLLNSIAPQTENRENFVDSHFLWIWVKRKWRISSWNFDSKFWECFLALMKPIKISWQFIFMKLCFQYSGAMCNFCHL